MRKVEAQGQRITLNPNNVQSSISQGELDERARALATVKLTNTLVDPVGEQLLDMSWISPMLEPAYVALETMNEMRQAWYETGNGWRVLLDKSYHASRARSGHMLLEASKLAALQLSAPPEEEAQKPYDLSR